MSSTTADYPTAYKNSVPTTPADGVATYMEKVQDEAVLQAHEEAASEPSGSGAPGLPTEHTNTTSVVPAGSEQKKGLEA